MAVSACADEVWTWDAVICAQIAAVASRLATFRRFPDQNPDPFAGGPKRKNPRRSRGSEWS
jgi:hypothetical protein